jgi:hypothetical protein
MGGDFGTRVQAARFGGRPGAPPRKSSGPVLAASAAHTPKSSLAAAISASARICATGTHLLRGLGPREGEAGSALACAPPPWLCRVESLANPRPPARPNGWQRAEVESASVDPASALGAPPAARALGPVGLAPTRPRAAGLALLRACGPCTRCAAERQESLRPRFGEALALASHRNPTTGHCGHTL